MLGYTGEELRGVHFSTVIHPEDRDANVKDIQRLQTGELPFFEAENRYVHKDGQPVWVHKFVSVLTDAAGKPAHMVALANDITRRKQAEEALRESEARLRLALDAAYVISFEWDIQQNQVRRFTSSDPTLGPTPEQAPSTFEAVRQAVHPEDRELFTANVLAALSSEDGRYENEFRIVHPDGEVAWLFERGYVERDEQDRPPG
jgi:PAS domain S-box-containing protein